MNKYWIQLLESYLAKIKKEQDKFDTRFSNYLRYESNQRYQLEKLNRLGHVSSHEIKVKTFEHHIVLPELYDKTGRFAPGEQMIQYKYLSEQTNGTIMQRYLHINVSSDKNTDNNKQNVMSVEQAQQVIDRLVEKIRNLIEVAKRPTIKLKEHDTNVAQLQDIVIEPTKPKRNKEDIVTIKRTHTDGPKRSEMELGHLYAQVNNDNYLRKDHKKDLFSQIEKIEEELKSYRRYIDLRYISKTKPQKELSRYGRRKKK